MEKEWFEYNKTRSRANAEKISHSVIVQRMLKAVTPPKSTSGDFWKHKKPRAPRFFNMSHQGGYLGKVWAISIFHSCPRVLDRLRHWLLIPIWHHTVYFQVYFKKACWEHQVNEYHSWLPIYLLLHGTKIFTACLLEAFRTCPTKGSNNQSRAEQDFCK